jgi:hypothetical protein
MNKTVLLILTAGVLTFALACIGLQILCQVPIESSSPKIHR